MNNRRVERMLDNCAAELTAISIIFRTVSIFSPQAQFLTRYALIKSCGTIELGYKSLIADRAKFGATNELKSYVDAKLLGNSRNPSYEVILDALGDFSEDWEISFRQSINGRPDRERLKNSLISLKNGRNTFAHGGIPTVSFAYVNQYFDDSRLLLEALDAVLV